MSKSDPHGCGVRRLTGSARRFSAYRFVVTFYQLEKDIAEGSLGGYKAHLVRIRLKTERERVLRVAADIHLIDDDDGVRSVLAAMMQRLGYRVRTFFSADEHLEWLRSDEYSPPNLSILSDVEMPGMSGYELMNVVRKTYPEQRFIITTGGRQSIAPENTYPCFYFNKPVSIGQLKKAFEVQSRCVKSGPDADCFGCASIGNRHAFGIRDWHCPMTAT